MVIYMINRVRERRCEMRMTQMQLAIKAETDPQHISRIENGHRPGLLLAQKLARGLNTTLDHLFPANDEAA